MTRGPSPSARSRLFSPTTLRTGRQRVVRAWSEYPGSSFPGVRSSRPARQTNGTTTGNAGTRVHADPRIRAAPGRPIIVPQDIGCRTNRYGPRLTTACPRSVWTRTVASARGLTSGVQVERADPARNRSAPSATVQNGGGAQSKRTASGPAGIGVSRTRGPKRMKNGRSKDFVSFRNPLDRASINSGLTHRAADAPTIETRTKTVAKIQPRGRSNAPAPRKASAACTADVLGVPARRRARGGVRCP